MEKLLRSSEDILRSLKRELSPQRRRSEMCTAKNFRARFLLHIVASILMVHELWLLSGQSHDLTPLTAPCFKTPSHGVTQ